MGSACNCMVQCSTQYRRGGLWPVGSVVCRERLERRTVSYSMPTRPSRPFESLARRHTEFLNWRNCRYGGCSRTLVSLTHSYPDPLGIFSEAKWLSISEGGVSYFYGSFQARWARNSGTYTLKLSSPHGQGLLGDVEVAEEADEAGEDPAPLGPEGGVEPGQYSTTGRIST